MQDKAKTKEQLLTELNQLCERVAELEREREGCKRTEEEVQAQRNLFETVVDSLPAAVNIVRALDLKILLVNEEYQKFAPGKQMVGKTIQEVWPELPELEQIFREVAATGKPFHTLDAPYRIRRAENGPLDDAYFSWSLFRIRLPGNAGWGLLNTAWETTDRKRTEEALRESDERLRAVLDATPFPTAVVDLQDDNIHFWSRSALTVFGHTASTASEWYQIAYPDPDYRREVINRWKPYLEKARDSRKPVNTGEYRVTCKDGSVRICELYAAFLPHILIITFNDITERKQAEETLKESEEKFRNIFQLHSAIKLIIEPDTGNIVDANEASAKFYGWSVEQLKKMRIQDINMSSAEQVKAEMEKARSLDCTHFEFLHRLADGSVRHVDVYSSKIEIKGKELLHSIVHDITDRKRAEEELLKVKKLEATGFLARGIAHDFNNLLSIVLGNINLAQLKVGSDGDLERLLLKAEKTVLRATDLTTKFITFSEGGKPKRRLYDIKQLLTNTIKHALSGSNIVCSYYFPDDLWQVDVDREQFNEVILILVTNAMEAMPAGGSIDVSVNNFEVTSQSQGIGSPPKDRQYVHISIQDHGSGIPKENLGKIFDPYFSTKEMGSQKGMGLGLTMAHSIAEKHGGTISVEPSIEGVGTTFHLYFPASKK
ncbi:MAG: PAS domain S-box protein [Desulfoferrobacter sp.]